MAFAAQLFRASASGSFTGSLPANVRCSFIARPGVASTHSFVVVAKREDGGKVLAELRPAYEALHCDAPTRSVMFDRSPCACLRFSR